jgi:hypothetical protein
MNESSSSPPGGAGSELICNYVPTDVDQAEGPCGNRAAWHIHWEQHSLDIGMACAEHLAAAQASQPHDMHPINNFTCGMPGAGYQFGDPSRCVFQVDTDDAELLVAKQDPESPFVYWPKPGVRFSPEQVQRMQGNA